MADSHQKILRIADILTEKHWSVKKLSDEIQPEGSENERLNYSYLTQIVRNQKFPRPEYLREIAKALNVDIRELFVSTKPVGVQKNDTGYPIYKKDDQGELVEIGYLKD